MKININISEITIKITLAKGPKKHENLLAYAVATFKGENGDFIAISGFTIWRSKFDNQKLNVECPRNKNFKYFLMESSLWAKLQKEISNAYEYEKIPVVEENENTDSTRPI